MTSQVKKFLWKLRQKQKALLLSLFILILIVLIKNIIFALPIDEEWYYKPLISFLKLLQTASALILLATIVKQIKLIGAILTTIIMFFFFLVFTEVVFCVLYEWKHSPYYHATEETKKKSASGAQEQKKKTIVDPIIHYTSVQKIDSLNFTAIDKVSGAPAFQDNEGPNNDWKQQDSIMGYKNKINADVSVTTWYYGNETPEVCYTTDSLGRRINGLNTVNSSQKKYALFLGCSTTFGQYVNNNQTMPAFFEGIDTNFKSYNYGVSGYGSHHVLAMLESRNLRKEIFEKDGIAIYTYFIGHTNRAIGDMDSYLTWNTTGPYYYSKGNTVERNGNFKTGRKFVSWFYEFLPTTYFGKYFDFHLPGKLRPWHYRLVAKMIQKANDEYKRQFGNDNFYVLLLPGWDDDMKKYLDELHIKTIDATNIVNSYWDSRYQFEGNGHPRPLFYRILAEFIHDKIKT